MPSSFGEGSPMRGSDAPWGNRPSICAHVAAHVDPVTGRLDTPGRTLPDDAELYGQDGRRWVAGGPDGVIGHQGGSRECTDHVQSLFAALKKALAEPSQTNIEALYALLNCGRAMDTLGPLLKRIVSDGTLDAGRLRTLALWLATEAADREPVKTAIALLGIVRGHECRDILLKLGRHEEFTLFVAAALKSSEADPEPLLWDLAKSVSGWGRIHVVRRLAGTQDPAIKRWLLTEGFKNDVMTGYLALPCAVTGELHVALHVDGPDDELLAGAGGILRALIWGGDVLAGGIRQYEHGPRVLELYLRHLPEEPRTVDQFRTLIAIQSFLEEQHDAKEPCPWPTSLVSRLAAATSERLSHPAWRMVIERGLAAPDRMTFWTAAAAAEELGIDTWDEHYRRLEAGEDYWHSAMRSDRRDRIERVVALAEERLPLKEIATGPAMVRRRSPEFRPHGALGWVLHGLRRFPGLGLPLIHAGMRSPVIANRREAIVALAAWERSDWPSATVTHVESCLRAEPEDSVRMAFDRLLSGRPLDDN